MKVFITRRIPQEGMKILSAAGVYEVFLCVNEQQAVLKCCADRLMHADSCLYTPVVTPLLAVFSACTS